ncbi:MAG: hypothetical protein E7309_04885 [Butyrivibrio sp.]|jgi:hypothetical protein|nr:hypothetical protein [Butyrivibrio sp.]
MLGVFRIIVLAITFCGYVLWLRKKFDLSIYIIPAIIVNAITSVMLVSGLLNIMPIIAGVLILLGFVLFYKYFDVAKDIANHISKNVFPMIIMSFFCIYILWYLWGGVYSDGDTMNHWAIIVREMIKDNRLPNFTNTAIAYQSYPPATACWIYFVDLVIGYSEMNSLFAQSFWILSCVISLFSINKKRFVVIDLFVSVFFVYVLVGTSCGLDTLKVDTLLGLTAMAGMIVVYEIGANFWYIALFFCISLTMVKNSGILFSFFLIIEYLIIHYYKDGCYSRSIKRRSGIAFGTSAFIFLLWQKHIAMVYEEASATRHGLRLGSMKGIFDARSMDDVISLIKNFFIKWFTINNQSYEWIFLLILTILFTVVLLVLSDKRKIWIIYISNLAAYLVYKLGLLGMYMFNMPGDEAVEIAEYVRYQEAFNLLLFVSIIYYIKLLLDSDLKNSYKRLIIIVLAVLSAGVCLLYFNKVITRPDYTNGGLHRKLYSLIMNPEEEISYGDKVLTYDQYWLQVYAVKYSMDNYDCKVTYDVDVLEEALTTNENEYDYIYISTLDDTVVDLLRQYSYGEDTFLISLK